MLSSAVVYASSSGVTVSVNSKHGAKLCRSFNFEEMCIYNQIQEEWNADTALWMLWACLHQTTPS